MKKQNNAISFFIFLILVMFVACHKSEGGGQTSSTTTSNAVTTAVNTEPEEDLSLLSPLESIKELDRKLDSYNVSEQLTEDQRAANMRLKQKIIRGTFDIAELARIALDKHWDEISEADRTRFVSLMTTLLEKKAILSKEQVKGSNKPYNIIYSSETYLPPAHDKAEVATHVRVPSSRLDISITYRLLKSRLGWKIYDVIVDDASLVDNYRYQFDTIIKKNGFADLIGRMDKKLQELH